MCTLAFYRKPFLKNRFNFVTVYIESTLIETKIHWSTRFQIFASASYLLSDLFSPDDVHALPAINTTEQEQGTEDEESYEADFLDISFGDDEEDDTAVASKVRVAHFVETRVLISTVKKLT